MLAALLLSAFTVGDAVIDTLPSPFSGTPEGADMAVYSLYKENVDSDHGKAMKFAELFLEGVDSSAADVQLGRMCDELAEWNEKESAFSTAVKWRKQALKQYEACGDEAGVSSAMYSLAKLYYRTGEYHKSLEYLTDVVPVFRKNGDMVSLMECSNLLGGVYFACGDYDQAFEYFQDYAEAAKDAGDSLRLCVALSNLSAYASISGDTMKTEMLIKEAIGIGDSIHDSLMMGRSRLNLSSFYINQGRYSDAACCLDSAKNYLADVSQKGKYWLNWCILLRHTGDTLAANDSLHKAISSYDSGEYDKELLKCYNLMIDNCSSLADTAGMFRAAWKYHEVAERLGNKDTDLQLFQYQNEIIRQKEAEKIIGTRSARKVYISISLCILMVAGMGLWLYGRNRAYLIHLKEDELEKQILINRENEQEIRSKNEILEIKKLEQYKTERVVMEMTGKLQDICRSSKDKEITRKITQLCSEMRHSMKTEMEDFQNFVPEFSSDFFQKLLKRFPDLTVNERRLCALLHMNLSTKEISEITRQSPHSINIARGRLREKLGLKGSRLSIQEFLSSL